MTYRQKVVLVFAVKISFFSYLGEYNDLTCEKCTNALLQLCDFIYIYTFCGEGGRPRETWAGVPFLLTHIYFCQSYNVRKFCLCATNLLAFFAKPQQEKVRIFWERLLLCSRLVGHLQTYMIGYVWRVAEVLWWIGFLSAVCYCTAPEPATVHANDIDGEMKINTIKYAYMIFWCIFNIFDSETTNSWILRLRCYLAFAFSPSI